MAEVPEACDLTFPGVKYKLELRGQTDATFRVKLNEAYPLKQVTCY